MPMRSSAAERTRPTAADGVVVALVLLGAAALLALFRPGPGNLLTATVVMESKAITSFDLTAAEPATFEVPGAAYPITLELEDNRIRVLHSDCPSQDCVRTGWVSRSGGQIVCLPNRLVVSLQGTEAPEVDGVVG